MGSNQEFVDFVIAQAGLGAALTARKMFGEYALYLEGRVVALVCDNQLFLRPTPEGAAVLGTVSEHPPYPGAKLHYRLSDALEERETLQAALLATAAVLPMPKARKPRKNAGTKSAKKPRR